MVAPKQLVGLRRMTRNDQSSPRSGMTRLNSDAPVFLGFAAVFALAGGHLARDDGREKCWVNDADGTILQGGEFQRGANANGDYIHGSNEARAHYEGGPFKVFIQD